MGDQRRNSWPWRKLTRFASSGLKSVRAKSSRFSFSPNTSPHQPSEAEAERSRDVGSSWKEEAKWQSIESARIEEATALREEAEDTIKVLKQELISLTKEIVEKENLVKQHQKVANEAVSGWEKAQEEILSLKQELKSASQRAIILEDRIAHLDGALKECTRKIRNVTDEQEAKLRELMLSKAKELAEVKSDMDKQRMELQRRLLEADAQNNAMANSLQERARKILEVNEAKSNAEESVKVLQVRLASSEKEISSLQYELHLSSKELEIRNEEVVYCKKTADAAHKQHLDNVQKVAKLEADCQRLRNLLKKKLPGPAALAQMRKEVEGLPMDDAMSTMSATSVTKRRPNRSYSNSTISFSNSHQHASGASRSNRNIEMLRDRLAAMEEENRLLKEALSKRIGELQASWLLCAKTASKLSIAEDHLESLQGTPREKVKTDRFSMNSPTPEILGPGMVFLSDVEAGFEDHVVTDEASCAESWASALIDELDHFKREKTVTKETIKEVTESFKSHASVNVDEDHSTTTKHGDFARDDTLVRSETGVKPEMNADRVWPNSRKFLDTFKQLCVNMDKKLYEIEEMFGHATGRGPENEEVMGLLGVVRSTCSELDREIQLWQSLIAENDYGIAGITKAGKDESGYTQLGDEQNGSISLVCTESIGVLCAVGLSSDCESDVAAAKVLVEKQVPVVSHPKASNPDVNELEPEHNTTDKKFDSGAAVRLLNDLPVREQFHDHVSPTETTAGVDAEVATDAAAVGDVLERGKFKLTEHHHQKLDADSAGTLSTLPDHADTRLSDIYKSVHLTECSSTAPGSP
ncbi:hypothetical protein KP509_13G092800 [Ceratopteris richardii]|uniref:Filament-like plant protein 7 n=1 Tax=Ceratopteris richardii TaxID=49495 RepID=A0A8T2THN8_CERRI|nr:hypothetical protein KP509_13G092800 [Ceratopteris richardii]